jgi:hypothetical protein
MRPPFCEQVYETEVKPGHACLSAEQEKEHRADDQTNRKVGTQLSEVSGSPEVCGDDPKYDPDEAEQKSNDQEALERGSFREKSQSRAGVQTRFDRH